MATEMSVTSREIAEAAVEYWRQGLPEDQVNERLQATIKYAKISGLEFSDAAELMTSATNTYGVAADKVADIWSVLGDESATGADEIGKAMSKASASASEFGLSFEWLGAYIATISEKTREAPEVIGTSLNTLMGRLHSIKQKGFNEEDETKINDVAKALSTVNIALLDQDGNWRNMNVIFDEIASKWTAMTDKQRSYIATTMAGTRQQNRFITLMNDMAKRTTGQSRAYNLYAEAIGAAGKATEKYAIWQESVAASQDRMTSAFEGLYALMNADWMTSFYDGIALVVNGITNATEASKGWVPILAALTGAVVVFVRVVMTATQSLGAMFTAFAGSHPIILAVTVALAALAAFTGIANGIANSIETPVERIARLNEEISESKAFVGKGDELNELKDRYDELANKIFKTRSEYQEMEDLKSQMTSILNDINDETTAYGDLTAAIEAYNKEKQRELDLNAKRFKGIAAVSQEEYENKRQEAMRNVEGAQNAYDETRTNSPVTYDVAIQNVKSYNNEIAKLTQEMHNLEKASLTASKENESWDVFGITPTEYDTYQLSIGSIKENIAEMERQRSAYAQFIRNVDASRDDLERVKKEEADILAEYLPTSSIKDAVEATDKAGKGAALAFLNSFKMTAEHMTDENFNLYDIVFGDTGLLNSTEMTGLQVEFDALYNSFAGKDRIVSINEWLTAWDSVKKKIAEVTQVGEESLDYTNTEAGMREEMLASLKASLESLGVDAEKVFNAPTNVQGIDALDEYTKKVIRAKEMLDKLQEGSNVDLFNRRIVSAEKMWEAGWEKFKNSKDRATVYSGTFHSDDFEIDTKMKFAITATPILENGEALSPETFESYIADLLQLGDKQKILDADKEGYNIVMGISEGAFSETVSEAEKIGIVVSDVHSMFMNGQTMIVDWASAVGNYFNSVLIGNKTVSKEMEQAMEGITSAGKETGNQLVSTVETVEEAVSNAVKAAEKAYNEALDQGELKQAQKDNYKSVLDSLGATLREGGFQEFQTEWLKLGEPLRAAIMSAYPEMAKLVIESQTYLSNIENAGEDIEALAEANKVAADEAAKGASAIAKMSENASEMNENDALNKAGFAGTEGQYLFNKFSAQSGYSNIKNKIQRFIDKDNMVGLRKYLDILQ